MLYVYRTLANYWQIYFTKSTIIIFYCVEIWLHYYASVSNKYRGDPYGERNNTGLTSYGCNICSGHVIVAMHEQLYKCKKTRCKCRH